MFPEPLAIKLMDVIPVILAPTVMLLLLAVVCSVTWLPETVPFTFKLPADVTVSSPVATSETPVLIEIVAFGPPAVEAVTSAASRLSVAVPAPADFVKVTG